MPGNKIKQSLSAKELSTLTPISFLRTCWLVFEREGQFDHAIERVQEAGRTSGDSTLVKGVLAGTFAFAGRHTDARAVLCELEQIEKEKYVSPIPIAIGLAAPGERDAAFARLQDAVRIRCPRTIEAKVDPRFDALRSDPRFVDLLRRIGFPE